jgi:hypothetical protein
VRAAAFFDTVPALLCRNAVRLRRSTRHSKCILPDFKKKAVKEKRLRYRFFFNCNILLYFNDICYRILEDLSHTGDVPRGVKKEAFTGQVISEYFRDNTLIVRLGCIIIGTGITIRTRGDI